MRAYLFNASTRYYNRGLAAYAYWLRDHGYTVEISSREPDLFNLDGALFAFSAVFTWDLPRLVGWVNRVKDFGDVRIGGPAVSAMPRYVQQQTGIAPFVGVDMRFERQPGLYKMTRTSRGCPVGCSFCIVPKIDGTAMIEYPDFSPAPVIMDDNILACSIEHQERVIERTLAQGYRVVDMNSGFEPHYFTPEAFERFRRLPLKFWRLGFDEVSEEAAVKEMMRLLRESGISSRNIRVYCLIGNESFDECHYRAEKIIEWGGEPHVQPLIPLNALEKRPVVQRRYGWTEQRLADFARYYTRWLWRKPGRSFDWYNANFRAATAENERSGHAGRANDAR
jgi:hypothetical protein